jgi:hypothetical protein
MKDFLKTIDKNIEKKTFVSFILILFIASFLLLFPSFNLHPVFSKGEFAYPQSSGIILAFLAILMVVYYISGKKIYTSKKISKKAKNFIFLGALAFGVLILLFVVGSIWIRFTVRSSCQSAKREYGGDCVEALITQLEDEKRNFKSRNDAVWALGQLADKKALPILEKYFTGNIPSQESPYKVLSQYELRKAVKWCREGNITRWMYYDQDNWN